MPVDLSHDSSHGHLYNNILPALTALAATLAIFAAASPNNPPSSNFMQTCLALHGLDENITTRPAVASVRRAVLEVFFSKKSNASTPTRAGVNRKGAAVLE
jgi:hypothetical protein